MTAPLHVRSARTALSHRLAAGLLLALGALSLAAPGHAAEPEPPKPPQVDMARFDYGLQARALAEGVWVVEGRNADFEPANGCNIINTGFIATGSGVLVINTGPSKRYGEQLRALIARTTKEPVVQVIHLNLHPDYFLGNQAFADVPRVATPSTRAGMQREAKAYEDNLFRMCGDWMLGTESLLPDRDLVPDSAGRASLRLGSREFELTALSGHTDSDLVLVDKRSGIAFVGGLVFVDRIPTTPHARLPDWLASLDRLQAMQRAWMVPSHGPVRQGDAGLQGTRDYLRWLDGHLRHAAQDGAEITELLRMPVAAPFDGWAAVQTEQVRNIANLYPAYEREALRPVTTRPAPR